LSKRGIEITTYDGNGSDWNLLLLARNGGSGAGGTDFRRADYRSGDFVRGWRAGNHFRNDSGTSAWSFVLKINDFRYFFRAISIPGTSDLGVTMLDAGITRFSLTTLNTTENATTGTTNKQGDTQHCGIRCGVPLFAVPLC